MNYAEACTYLDTLHYMKEFWDLENTRGLLAKLGNPHLKLRILHVAGTNGKGSVCAMLTSILMHAGYRVGLNISPHLKEVTERFTTNRIEISKEEFAAYLSRIKPLVMDHSYFEVLTVLAFLYFSEKNVDFLVLETGMGGRLDATNVCNSLVSVITQISLEHTNRLGTTHAAIAKEKAGIIKPNTICITGTEGDARAVIEERCREVNTQLINAEECNLPLGLQGSFQRHNAGIAVAAIHALKKYTITISEEHITSGLKDAKWPGRLEFVEPNVLLDCAHNPGGMECLTHELKILKTTHSYERLIVVLGIVRDKEYEKMLKIIEPLADVIIITKAATHRALDPQILANLLTKEATIIENPMEALAFAKAHAAKNDLVLVTGSIYLIGDVYPERKT